MARASSDEFHRPATPATVRRIFHRHDLFRLGFLGLLLAAVMFAVGFSVPAWADQMGLWVSCAFRPCQDVKTGPAWFHAARSMEVLALICFILSVAVELYQDVFKSPPPKDNKAVEILGVAAGVAGLIGVIVFASKVSRDWVYGYFYIDVQGLSWGLVLTASGSVLGLLSAVLMGFSRVRHAEQTLQALAMANPGVTTASSDQPPSPLLTSMEPVVTESSPLTAEAAGSPGFADADTVSSPVVPSAPPAPMPEPTAQGRPTSFVEPAPGVATSYLTPAQGVAASHTTPAQGVSTSYLTPAPPAPIPEPSAQGRPPSYTEATQGMSTSHVTSTPRVPTSHVTAAQGAPMSQVTAAQGVPTSHIPLCFIMVQGQMVPVYRELPGSAMGAEQGQTPVDSQHTWRP
ncbi:uncharacterized protein LOC143291976 [Babylonia areolata]|uniref:uncharacterized protein LOC143291976 n=1 Tax=Babylonia areolata TaxID=304850 RepID=UPI003FCF4164